MNVAYIGVDIVTLQTFRLLKAFLSYGFSRYVKSLPSVRCEAGNIVTIISFPNILSVFYNKHLA